MDMVDTTTVVTATVALTATVVVADTAIARPPSAPLLVLPAPAVPLDGTSPRHRRRGACLATPAGTNPHPAHHVVLGIPQRLEGDAQEAARRSPHLPIPVTPLPGDTPRAPSSVTQFTLVNGNSYCSVLNPTM